MRRGSARAKRFSMIAVSISIAAAISAACGWCDEAPQQFTEDANDTGKDKLVAARTETPPKIDGALDDDCWKTATRLTTFRIGSQPGQGLLASEQAEVLVTSDGQALYFAFICHESEVGKIAAHQTQYDGSFDLDDFVALGFDVFCDQTRSYAFYVNPLGTRRDRRWGDDRWNASWQSAAKVTKDAWTVEIAIPFSILTMPKGAKKFGFNCGRFLQRKSEFSTWKYTKNYSDREFAWAELTGFHIGSARRPDRYLGYVVGSRRFEEPGSTRGHVGGDWEHPLSSTSTAMLTLNPDWSQIEAAYSGIDFTYIERLLPEVRPFFVESLPYLPTNILFYPQGRIYRFDEGLKLTGTEGRFRFGVLGMLGVQRFADVPSEDDLAARLWYDFSRETYLNVSDVRSGTDNCTHVEFVHEHTGKINSRTVAAYYHQSSDEPDLGGSEAYLRTYAQTEDWFGEVSWENTGDNLRPALGRLPRPGIHRVSCQFSRYFNPKPDTAWFETATASAAYTRRVDHQGNLDSEESSAWLWVQQGPKLSFGLGPSLYRHPGPTGTTFDDLTWSASVNLFPRKPPSAWLIATVGTIEESGYRNVSVGGEARTRGDRLAVDASLEWTRWSRRSALSLHGSEEDAHQFRVGLTRRLGKRTTFAVSQRWLKQAAQSRSIFSAVFRKQFGVDHDLYIIFGDPQDPNETINQIMVKYVMPFGKWGER